MALTQISTQGIKDGTITNADIGASAAIDGSKVSPSFTSDITITNNTPTLNFVDNNENSDFQINVEGGKFTIRDTTNTATRLKIHSNGLFQIQSTNTRCNNLQVDGNLGIGTGNPTGKLTIVSGTFQTTNPTSTGDDIVISGNQSLGIQFLTLASGTSNNNIYFGDTDDPDIGMIRYAHADNSLQFRTNTSERMRIDSDGDVLVGLTTALSTQAGSIQAAGPIITKSYINSHTSNATVIEYISNLSKIRAYGATSGSGQLAFNVGGGGDTTDFEAMRIDTSGRVGIGTTSPNVSGFNSDANVLTLSGPKRGFIELRGNTQAADSIGGIRFFSANNLEAEILSVTDSSYNGDLRFNANGIEGMRLDTDGVLCVTSNNIAYGSASNNFGKHTKVVGPGFLGPNSNVTITVGVAYAGGRAVAHAAKTSDVSKQKTVLFDVQARGTGNMHRSNENTVTQNGGVNFSIHDHAQGFKIINQESFTITYALSIDIVGNIPLP